MRHIAQANGYQIDFDHWHAAVHGTLPYEQMLQEDRPLRQLLQSIDLPKYVFTNADKKHAETCLRLLDISDLFKVIHIQSNQHKSLCPCVCMQSQSHLPDACAATVLPAAE